MKKCTQCKKKGEVFAYWGKQRKRICHECSTAKEVAALQRSGKGFLYLNEAERVLTNWAGLFEVPITFMNEGKHNIARIRVDVWFKLKDDPFVWHGVQYGEWTQVCHVKRTKRTKW